MKTRKTITYVDPASKQRAEAEVIVDIDVDRIAAVLGARACANASRESQALNGLVIVRREGTPRGVPEDKGGRS